MRVYKLLSQFTRKELVYVGHAASKVNSCRPRRRRGSTSEENKEVPPAVSGSTPKERRFLKTMSQLRFYQQNGDPFWKKGTSGFDQHVDFTL